MFLLSLYAEVPIRYYVCDISITFLHHIIYIYSLSLSSFKSILFWWWALVLLFFVMNVMTTHLQFRAPPLPNTHKIPWQCMFFFIDHHHIYYLRKHFYIDGAYCCGSRKHMYIAASDTACDIVQLFCLLVAFDCTWILLLLPFIFTAYILTSYKNLVKSYTVCAVLFAAAYVKYLKPTVVVFVCIHIRLYGYVRYN